MSESDLIFIIVMLSAALIGTFAALVVAAIVYLRS